MSGDQIKHTDDHRKSPALSEQKSLDLARVAAKPQEKLVLDATRRFLPEGSGQGESSNYDSKYVEDKLKQMNINKENMSKKYNDIIEEGKKVYQEAKEKEQYEKYTKKYGGTKHHR